MPRKRGNQTAQCGQCGQFTSLLCGNCGASMCVDHSWNDQQFCSSECDSEYEDNNPPVDGED